jgi:hypothetical protein
VGNRLMYDKPQRRTVLDLISEPSLRSVVQTLVDKGASVPEVGYELVDERGRVTGEWELAWPEARVAVAQHPADQDAPGPIDWQTFAVEEVLRAPEKLEALLLTQAADLR